MNFVKTTYTVSNLILRTINIISKAPDSTIIGTNTRTIGDEERYHVTR